MKIKFSDGTEMELTVQEFDCLVPMKQCKGMNRKDVRKVLKKESEKFGKTGEDRQFQHQSEELSEPLTKNAPYDKEYLDKIRQIKELSKEKTNKEISKIIGWPEQRINYWRKNTPKDI